jgi:hypothetical protein
LCHGLGGGDSWGKGVVGIRVCIGVEMGNAVVVDEGEVGWQGEG